MPGQFLNTFMSEASQEAQARYYGRAMRRPAEGAPDALGPDEAAFIAERDSFYLGSVTSDGWPYIQHRGGPAGFLRILDERTLGFADFGGNRQMISTGNLATNPRVSLFLMDYTNRVRLKIAGEARVLDAREHPDLVAKLAHSRESAPKIERLFLIDVKAFDWNCPQHITPRYTPAEVEVHVAGLHQRIVELEAKLAGLEGP